MDSSIHVLLPEIWGWICKGLSIWSCLQLSVTDKHIMGRLVAAEVTHSACAAICVGQINRSADVHIKRYTWFNRDYITRIEIGWMVAGVKTIIHNNGEVLVIDRTDHGTRYIHTSNGKARHLVIVPDNIPDSESGRAFVVLCIIDPIDILEFIGTWAAFRHRGTQYGGPLKIDYGLEKQLTALYEKSDAPAQQRIPTSNCLLMRPDVMALLSPK